MCVGRGGERASRHCTKEPRGWEWKCADTVKLTAELRPRAERHATGEGKCIYKGLSRIGTIKREIIYLVLLSHGKFHHKWVV